MNLERGFLRIVVALSLAVLGIAVSLDMPTYWASARVDYTRVGGHRRSAWTTRDDARQIAAWSHDPVRNPPPHARATWEQLLRGLCAADPDCYSARIPLDPSPLPPPNWETLRPVTDPAIQAVLEGFPAPDALRVAFRPASWWWTEATWTPLALVLVALLWAGFFTVRWVARGFTSQQSS